MATFSIDIPGCILCCDTGSQITAGENLSLTVDTVKYPGFAFNPISALVNSLVSATVYDPVTNSMVAGYTYNVTIDDSVMPVVMGSPLTELDITDITAWECESCCVALDVRITALEESLGLGTTYWIDGPVVDDTDPVITPAVAKDGDTVVQVNISGNYEFWHYDSGWVQDFVISSGGAPRVLSGLGAPGGAPSTIDASASDAAPAVYWDQTNDIAYYWDLAAVGWISDIAAPRVLTGTVDPAGAPSTIDASAKDAKPATYWQQTTNVLWAWDVGATSWHRVTGPRQVLQGANAPVGLPSAIDSGALNTLPALYWATTPNTLYSWELTSLTWTLVSSPDAGGLDIAYNGIDTNVLDFTHTGSDGVADTTTDSTAGPGAVNSLTTESIVGNDTGTYTIHNIRGGNDGTALNTPTAGDAQKVMVDEVLSGLFRTTTIVVESYVKSVVFLDLTYGDDATGIRERSDRPFLTYSAAHTAALDGDTIVVYSSTGVYTPPVPADGIYAVGKSIAVDLSNINLVEGTLVAEDGETLTVLGECDFYNFNADGGNIRGRIGRLLHPATFASFALDGGGSSPTVDLDIQSIEDSGGSSVNGYLLTTSDGSVVNLNIRGGVVSSGAAFNVTNADSGGLTAKINGSVNGDDANSIIAIASTADSSVVAQITIDGDLSAGSSGPIAASASAGKMILNVGGTIESAPADDAAGSTAVLMATDGGTLIVRAARVRHDSDGGSLGTWDGGILFVDVPLFEIDDATGFLMATAGASGTNILTVRGNCFVVYPGTSGNFHDNVSNTGTEIRFQGEVFTTLTGAANTSLPWPVEGADDTGCTFLAGTYTDTQDLAGY